MGLSGTTSSISEGRRGSDLLLHLTLVGLAQGGEPHMTGKESGFCACVVCLDSAKVHFCIIKELEITK